ncbi:alcohol dehydrogenase catalytic domain-containing protein [Nonomuraea rhodomycinica]|uniref:Alcohol dehydrogenase catalytic domain-containing protein n=1 Tax=Nonomuraea rhodomycinica TaxID=1712872 RepID=A0A7Y6MAH5_9ACTN|nr:alcohol dehydrogenase catalytic domain-containing protein [Nonomuraea rhodomycinica]NUW39484.1 alcohol dehydrogenase catalytic domain-containing protein [Nonomuraea rhodomycinica]
MFRRMAVTEPGGPLRPVEAAITDPEPGWVRVRVAAGGVCGADLGTVSASDPAGGFPITPGHEIAGVIDATGAPAAGWRTGDRVAVGWSGGSCGHCHACRTGDQVHCRRRLIPGLSYPGGWADMVTVPLEALARIPDGLSMADAAPMGCAGVTTFTAIRAAGLPPGSRVAVYGLGGLGHLAVQFAARMGHEVVVVARGTGREHDAAALGARHYIDATTQDAGRTLAELGGADLMLCTASSSEPVSALLAGLRVRGRLTLIGVDGGALRVPVARLVMNAQTVTGHLTGTPADIEDTMRFAAAHDVRPRLERLPLEQAGLAVRRLRDGQARYRLVLEP